MLIGMNTWSRLRGRRPHGKLVDPPFAHRTNLVYIRGSFSQMVNVGDSCASWIEGLCADYLMKRDDNTLNRTLTQAEGILDQAQHEEAQLLEDPRGLAEWKVAHDQTQSVKAVVQALTEVVCAVMMGFDEMLRMHGGRHFQYQSW